MTRVFIISKHLMFSSGLEDLLQKEAKFDIVGQETDFDGAIEQIKKLKPDVIIVDSDDTSAQIMPVLNASPGANVISLSLHHNKLFTYTRKQRVAKDVGDLVAAIEDDLTSLNANYHPRNA